MLVNSRNNLGFKDVWVNKDVYTRQTKNNKAEPCTIDKLQEILKSTPRAEDIVYTESDDRTKFIITMPRSKVVEELKTLNDPNLQKMFAGNKQFHTETVNHILRTDDLVIAAKLQSSILALRPDDPSDSNSKKYGFINSFVNELYYMMGPYYHLSRNHHSLTKCRHLACGEYENCEGLHMESTPVLVSDQKCH